MRNTQSVFFTFNPSGREQVDRWKHLHGPSLQKNKSHMRAISSKPNKKMAKMAIILTEKQVEGISKILPMEMKLEIT